MRNTGLYLVGSMLLVAGFVVSGAHVRDTEARAAALRSFLASGERDVSSIVRTYGIATPGCLPHASADGAMAAALVTTESFATSRLEGAARGVIVWLAAALAIEPTLSIGPARIRLKTAREALATSSAPEAMAYAKLSASELATRLLSACDALRIATQIARDIKGRADAPAHRSPRTLSDFVARTYNGQKRAAAGSDGWISAQVYGELVFRCYEYFRRNDFVYSARDM